MSNTILAVDFADPKCRVDKKLFTQIVSSAEIARYKDGLYIDNEVFASEKETKTLSHRDHVKTLLVFPKTYTVPQNLNQELLFEADVSSKQCFPDINSPSGVVPSNYISRIRCVYEDPRLCCSGVAAYDNGTRMVYMFLLTDQIIYALYGRRPEKSKGWVKTITHKKDYAKFMSLVPLIRRSGSESSDKLPDFHQVSLGFRYDETTKKYVVSWYVDGELKFMVDRIGYRLEEKYQVLDQGGFSYLQGIEQLKFGFGNYSFLDFVMPNNSSRDLVFTDYGNARCPVQRSCSSLVQLLPEENYTEVCCDFLGRHPSIIPEKTFAVTLNRAAEDSSTRMFGQGSILILRGTRIYTREDYSQSRIPFSCFSSSSSLPGQKPKKQKCSTCDETLDSTSQNVKDSERVPIYRRTSPVETSKLSSGTDLRDESPIRRPLKDSSDSSSDESSIRCQGHEINLGDVDERKQMKNLPLAKETSGGLPEGSFSDSSPRPTLKKNRLSEAVKHKKPFEDLRPQGLSDSLSEIGPSRSGIEVQSSSLETLGESLEEVIPKGCWLCKVECRGSCCGGKCGNLSCKNNLRKPVRRYKGDDNSLSADLRSERSERGPEREPERVKFVKEKYTM